MVEEILDKLIHGYFKDKNGSGVTPQGVSRYVCEEYRKLTNIKNSIEYKWDKIKAIQDKAALDVAAINAEIKTIRSQCTHFVTKHHSDASGNNDSWDECLICGANL